MVNRAELGGTGYDGAPHTDGKSRRPLPSGDSPTEYRVTSVGETPTVERARRMRTYFLTMSLRLVCVASLAFVHGWWALIPAVGAVVLPYFAVMIANAVESPNGDAPDPFTPQALTGNPAVLDTDGGRKNQGVIVVDAPAERRSQGTANPPTVRAPDPAEYRDIL